MVCTFKPEDDGLLGVLLDCDVDGDLLSISCIQDVDAVDSSLLSDFSSCVASD